MIEFLAPGWLTAAGGVAALGAWKVFAGRGRVVRVPAVWLWRGLSASTAARGRRVDPVWGCVALAALLASLAASQPVWRWGEAAMSEHPAWSIRSTPAATEAWAPRQAGDTLRVDRQAVATTVPAVELGPGDRHILTLEREGRRVAEATFRKPRMAPFHVLQVGAVDPAVARVLGIQPQATPDGGATVLLAAGDSFTAGDGAAARLVIVTGAATLPGVTLQGEQRGSWRPEGVDLPAFVHLDGVSVQRYVRATLGEGWHTEARVNGDPWIARRGGGERTLVWLASRPTADTDWPTAPSFVLYFSDLLHQVLPLGSGGGITVWEREEGVIGGSGVREVALDGFLGIGAALLLVGAMAGLWRRAGALRMG